MPVNSAELLCTAAIIVDLQRNLHYVRAPGTVHIWVVVSYARTRAQVSVTGIDVWRVRNGNCAEHWLALDNLGLMQQLGAIPAPGQAGA